MFKNIVIGLLVLLAIPTLYKGLKYAYGKYNHMEAKSYVGKEVSAVKGTDTEGNQYNLESYKGKNIVIVFWASWCGSCIREIPNVKEYYAALPKEGDTVFLSATVDDNVELALKTIEKKGIDYPVILDREHPGNGGMFNSHFKITHLPSIWVIDKQGKIVAENLSHIDEVSGFLK